MELARASMKSILKSISGKDLKSWEQTISHPETKKEIQHEIKRRKNKKTHIA